MNRLRTGVFIAGLLLNVSVRSQGLVIEHLALDNRPGEQTVVTALLDATLPTEVIAAIDSGVEISLRYELELLRFRTLWFAETLWSTEGEAVLSFRPLRERYVLTDNARSLEKSFFSMAHMLSFLQTFTLVLPPLDAAIQNADQIRFRMFLDRSALPAPLRLPGYFDRQWQLSTGWISTNVEVSVEG